MYYHGDSGIPAETSCHVDYSINEKREKKQVVTVSYMLENIIIILKRARRVNVSELRRSDWSFLSLDCRCLI